MAEEAVVPTLDSLRRYLTVRRTDFDRCLDVLEHALVLNGITATLRLHYLKFNAAREPMTNELADCLANHALDYCNSVRRRQDMMLVANGRQRLIEQTRALFRRADYSGEAGELLLYFFQEAVLSAPQLVAKMSLKTNPRLEVNGSDGIHGTWNPDTNTLDLFFGEAKIYSDYTDALRRAFISLERFHAEEMLTHEIPMISNHFKHVDETARRALIQYLEGDRGTTTVNTNHALLVGHTWDAYEGFTAQTMETILTQLIEAYRAASSHWRDLLQARFDGFSRRDLRFEVFLLPFQNVQAFRDAFDQALDRLA